MVDPKGEYGGLAAAWGVGPVALRAGGASARTPSTRDRSTKAVSTDTAHGDFIDG